MKTVHTWFSLNLYHQSLYPKITTLIPRQMGSPYNLLFTPTNGLFIENEEVTFQDTIKDHVN